MCAGAAQWRHGSAAGCTQQIASYAAVTHIQALVLPVGNSDGHQLSSEKFTLTVHKQQLSPVEV